MVCREAVTILTGNKGYESASFGKDDLSEV
jgi:hypothetical protein